MYTWIQDLLWPAFEALEERQKSGENLPGIPTGFPELDFLTGGWQAGDLIIISGATGMGKSALAYYFVARSAIPFSNHRDIAETTLPNSYSTGGKLTAFVSLEYPPERVVPRMICSWAGVDTNHVIGGRVTENDYTRLALTASHINQSPVYLVHSPRLGIADLASDLRKLKEKHELELIVVDTLNLIRVEGAESPATNREQEVGIVVRELKAIALELSVPVIATATLNRSVEQRYDKRPLLQDLRDSGDVENTADVVLFVFRPEYYYGPVDKEGNSIEGVAEMIVAKNRTGLSTWFPMRFSRLSGTFYKIGAPALQG